MARDNFSDLLAFLAVARERSFTKAASQLGVSQSALSHTIRGLETRLGVRLLTRTTRSVATTEAGERLMHVAAPRFDEIESELNALSELRDKPVGLIRITATDHPVNAILWPRLKPLLADYPGLKIEMSIDYNLSDIVAQRYDIGVRFGDQVANDMIAVRISPDVRMMIAGSPEYFARHPAPKCPQDLLEHACINLRLPTRGSLYAWELKKGKHDLLVRVDGQLIFNSTPQMLSAALEGFGLTYLPEDELMPHVRAGHLKCVLKEWGATFPGYHAYYPSRRQSSRALSLVIDALRHRD